MRAKVDHFCPEREALRKSLAFRAVLASEKAEERAPADLSCPASMFPRRRMTMEMEGRETGTLIGSDKVEGTAVYGTDAQKIGSIERVMIDKVSGRVSYAVLGFGGFLGIGDDHYPLPWQSLRYDTGLGGYRTNLTADRLQGAPKYGNDNAWDWDDPGRAKAVNDYYSGF
jgi:PRC-barrel domain